MQAITESKFRQKPPSRSSIIGLDLLSFLMADVRDGVGPYLSIFLKGALHWQSGDIGIAMAASSVTTAFLPNSCRLTGGFDFAQKGF
jgi:hypothetical protein